MIRAMLTVKYIRGHSTMCKVSVHSVADTVQGTGPLPQRRVEQLNELQRVDGCSR